MLVDPPIEKLLPRTKNRYTLAITIARRTRQLVDGAQPLVDETDNPNLVTLACKELAADKIEPIPGKLDPYIPLRPEVREALMNTREEDEENDMLPSNYTPLAEEPVPAPVSKIRVMDPNEVFLMPEEMEDEEDEKDKSRSSDIEDIDEDEDDEEDEVVFRGASDEEEEEIVSDDDLEHIDGSIDDMPEDEDEDL